MTDRRPKREIRDEPNGGAKVVFRIRLVAGGTLRLASARLGGSFAMAKKAKKEKKAKKAKKCVAPPPPRPPPPPPPRSRRASAFAFVFANRRP